MNAKRRLLVRQKVEKTEKRLGSCFIVRSKIRYREQKGSAGRVSVILTGNFFSVLNARERTLLRGAFLALLVALAVGLLLAFLVFSVKKATC